MARRIEELWKQPVTSKRRARIDRKKQELTLQMRLYELRRALNVTQSEIAALLDVKQSTVSKIEHSPDLFLSTLQRIVEALGAKLVIRAAFPDREIDLLLGELEEEEQPGVKKQKPKPAGTAKKQRITSSSRS